MQVPDDGSWRTQNFRQNMVTKIEEAILQCGTPTSKNAGEMENQVYSKATSKNEYLSFVARLILHIKEMGNKKGLASGGQPNQMQPGMGVQGSGGIVLGFQQGNVTIGLNQMGQQGMGMQGMPQQQSGGGGGMVMNQGGTMMAQRMGMNMNQQQHQQQGGPGMMGNQQSPQQVRIMAPGPGGGMVTQQQPPSMMMQQGVGVGGPQGGGGMSNIGQQSQGMQMGQPQQQNQMMNPNFINQQQMQQIQGGPGGMQQGGMNSPQMQQQMQNAQIQQALIHQQQQGEPQHVGVGAGRGMRMPMQQMQHMQRKAFPPRPMTPGGMGIPRPDHGSNYPMNRFYQFGSQQVDGGMASQFQGAPPGPQSGMARPGGPFLPPSASPGMAVGPAPSPGSMGVQGPSQPGYVNSPQPSHPHGSPAPPGAGIRPMFNQMVPSPGGINLNTPMPMAPTPSPRNPEEIACMRKIEELRRYTDMIQRMIVKIGNDDAEKSSKMKKLLDILMNPTRQVSMEILLKCEVALKKMEKQQHETTGPPSQPTMPPKDQVSPFLQLQEAILTTMKNGSASHTFLRTFRPSTEALTGQSGVISEPVDESEIMIEEETKTTSDLSPVLLREFKLMGRRFPFTFASRGENLPLVLRISLGDPKLPKVPPLKILISVYYPDESPTLIDLQKDYGSTSFLSRILQAFKSRKGRLPTRFTLYELLIQWETTVRQISNPFAKRKPNKRIEPVASQTTAGRIGLALATV